MRFFDPGNAWKLSLNSPKKALPWPIFRSRSQFERTVRVEPNPPKSRRGKRRNWLFLKIQVLRHTGALDILQATGDMCKVALWLGHGRAGTRLSGLHATTSSRRGKPSVSAQDCP